MKRFGIVATCLILAGAALVWAISEHEPERSDADAPAAEPSGPVRALIAGGGDAPQSNEISIEEDMLLAIELFPGPHTVLYAAGPKTRAVRVAVEQPKETLRQRLGTIFNPRAGRRSTYQATRIDADGPATPATVVDALTIAATADSDHPLTVYFAGHGGPGETAAQNTFALWGARSLVPADLSQAFSDSPPTRDVRIVMTTCFSGGFAEVAFDGDRLVVGDAPTGEVCGLFASTWDREAGGCDPNPERGLHDGYGVHFLNALAGKEVSPSLVSTRKNKTLLDAHTYARLRSGSIDVPTTTSEWHLRNAVPADAAGPPQPGLLPHEDHVVDELAGRLSLPDEPAVLLRLEELLVATEAAREAEAVASEAETEAYYDVAGELLARWPVLDDPWHPEWQATMDRDGEAIRAHLRASAAVAQLDDAMQLTNRLANDRAELEVRVAPLLRLARAHENRRLAAELQRIGGSDWTRFERLRRCEDSIP